MISIVTVLQGDWIADLSNPEEAGQFLHFPSTHIRSSSSSEAKELQLMVLESTSGPYAIEGLSHLPALEMPKLCEYVTSEGKASTASHAGSLPSLVLPSNHVTEHATPKAILTQSISRGASKWCQSIDHLGKIPFLSGFWDWSNYTAKMLSRYKMGALVDAVRGWNFSPGDARYLLLVNSRSILRGAYYEEVIPSYKELIEDLPPYCLLLFKAFAMIVQRENSERVTYADWLDFWYNSNPPYADPFKSKRYLDMSELKYDGNGNMISVPKLDRPLKWTFGHERKLRGVPEQWDRLGMLDVTLEVNDREKPLIAAYLCVWLARYEASLPMVRQFRGILNAYQPWEPRVADCRAVLRGNLSSDDFCWTLVPLPTHPGPRVDDGQRRADTLDFMVSIRAGYVVLRQEGYFTKKSYNPHRFARQHGFQQRLPGRHVKLPHGGEVSDLYRFWLSLTRVHSNTFLHIPSTEGGVASRVDPAYVKWWNKEVFPSISTMSIQFLKASEARNFIPSLMKSTKRNNAGDPSPSSKKQKCNRSPQREPDSLQHPLSTPAARQTSRQALYEEIVSSPKLRGLPRDEEMIGALDDFLETDTLKILGSLPSQIDGGVLSLNVGEQVTAKDGEVDSHDRQPSVKETNGLNPPAMTSSNPLKLKPTFSCITKLLEPISSQALAKPILFKAMSNYVQEEFSRGLQNGFSGLGQWWAERSSAISEALQLYFLMDVEPLLKTMDAYLSKVNLYLAKRDEVSTSLDVEERDKSLATLQKGISSNHIIHDSLSKEINELTKKKGSLESKIICSLTRGRRQKNNFSPTKQN
ncbi:hypothetical protein SLEP1_g17014 [Rubroshorea leprosula]|uniref:Aminotransferase-like plant mobile domain-containing protein n=1 Tax=Rubroshorea leprosula TaxID=152421 RepID=A0AAV5J3A2_9ROSI|nr:hypothetical protein SLEP1_g17014 [Rubroshorea leprosula]